MTVATTLSTWHSGNEFAPRVGFTEGVELETRQSGVHEQATDIPVFAHFDCRSKRGVPMNRQYRRQKERGRLHRTRIRVLLMPGLGVGDAVPTGTWLGHWLKINPSEAYRHLQRVLIEDGITVETRGLGPARKRYIVAISNNRLGEAA